MARATWKEFRIKNSRRQSTLWMSRPLDSQMHISEEFRWPQALACSHRKALRSLTWYSFVFFVTSRSLLTRCMQNCRLPWWLRICLPVQETWVRFLGWEDSLEKRMAYPLNYSFLENSMDRGAWQLRSTRSQRVRHDWATNANINCAWLHVFPSQKPDINWLLPYLLYVEWLTPRP